MKRFAILLAAVFVVGAGGAPWRRDRRRGRSHRVLHGLTLTEEGTTTLELDDEARDRTTRSRPSRKATTTETGEDISGPCDEAEHADDPRCTGDADRRA